MKLFLILKTKEYKKFKYNERKEVKKDVIMISRCDEVKRCNICQIQFTIGTL